MTACNNRLNGQIGYCMKGTCLACDIERTKCRCNDIGEKIDTKDFVKYLNSCLPNLWKATQNLDGSISIKETEQPTDK